MGAHCMCRSCGNSLYPCLQSTEVFLLLSIMFRSEEPGIFLVLAPIMNHGRATSWASEVNSLSYGPVPLHRAGEEWCACMPPTWNPIPTGYPL
eukprot:1160548-Pelagomonas_calceolata.AAC.14